MPEKNIVQTVHDTLYDEMKRDDNVLVLGEDVGARGGVFRATMNFLEEFGEDRVLDTPLDEALIAGVAIGMAIDGLKPVAEMQFLVNAFHLLGFGHAVGDDAGAGLHVHPAVFHDGRAQYDARVHIAV